MPGALAPKPPHHALPGSRPTCRDPRPRGARRRVLSGAGSLASSVRRGVAASTRRPLVFVVAHVEGASVPTLNGIPVSGAPVALKNGDLLELAGTRMQFMQA